MCRESASSGHLSSGKTYISIRCGAYTTDCSHVHKGIAHAAQWIYTDSLFQIPDFPTDWDRRSQALGIMFPSTGTFVPDRLGLVFPVAGCLPLAVSRITCQLSLGTSGVSNRSLA